MNKPGAEPQPLAVTTFNLRARYFRLIADGRKTIEVRVAYPRHADLAAGQLLTFVCDDDQLDVEVVAVNRYTDFNELLHHEDPASIDPTATPAQLLATLRDIYEANELLGTIAIHIRTPAGASAPTANEQQRN